MRVTKTLVGRGSHRILLLYFPGCSPVTVAALARELGITSDLVSKRLRNHDRPDVICSIAWGGGKPLQPNLQWQSYVQRAAERSDVPVEAPKPVVVPAGWGYAYA